MIFICKPIESIQPPSGPRTIFIAFFWLMDGPVVLFICIALLGHVFSQVAQPGSTVVGVGVTGSSRFDVTTRIGIPEPPKPPAVDYLGIGYDPIFGNPSEGEGPTMIDPGFRQPVIQMVFDALRSSAGFQEPWGVSLKQAPICVHAETAQEITTLTSYQQALALDAFVFESIFRLNNNSLNMSSGTALTLAALLPLLASSFTSANSPLASNFPLLAFVPLAAFGWIEPIQAFVGSASLQLLDQQLKSGEVAIFYSRSMCTEVTMLMRSTKLTALFLVHS